MLKINQPLYVLTIELHMNIRNLTLPENEQNKEYYKHEKKYDMKGNIVHEMKVYQCDMMEITDVDCKLVVFTCVVRFFLLRNNQPLLFFCNFDNTVFDHLI